MLAAEDHPDPVETVENLTRSQREALTAISFFRRQRKAGRGWLVGDKRLSEKIVEHLEKMQLVEELPRWRTEAAIDDRQSGDQGTTAVAKRRIRRSRRTR